MQYYSAVHAVGVAGKHGYRKCVDFRVPRKAHALLEYGAWLYMQVLILWNPPPSGFSQGLSVNMRACCIVLHYLIHVFIAVSCSEETGDCGRVSANLTYVGI